MISLLPLVVESTEGRANYDYTTTSLHRLCITTHTTYHCILGVLGATFCHLLLIYLSHYRADDSTCLTWARNREGGMNVVHACCARAMYERARARGHSIYWITICDIMFTCGLRALLRRMLGWKGGIVLGWAGLDRMGRKKPWSGVKALKG